MSDENNQTKNTGKEFELFTKSVYELLLHADGLTNCEVKHNIDVKGRSGCDHQIDVYWKFSFGGIEHQVAIECKDYSNNVSIGRIRDFHSAINDIGNIKGIFATKVGYQSGARQYGEYYGIDLKLVHPPTDDDFTGRIKRVVIQGHLILKQNETISPLLDGAWINTNCPELFGQNFAIEGSNDEIFVYDKESNPLINFFDMGEKLPAASGEGRFSHTYPFEDGYIKFDKTRMVKVSGIQFDYDVAHVKMEPIIIDAQQFVEAVIDDIKTGEKKFVRSPDAKH